MRPVPTRIPSAVSRRSSGALRSHTNAQWYAMRDRLHVERAALRARLLSLCGVLMTSNAAETIESTESFVRAIMWNGYDTFAAAASDLGECVPKFILAADADGDVEKFLEWLRSADARLGEFRS